MSQFHQAPDTIKDSAAYVADLIHQRAEIGDFYKRFLAALPFPAGTMGAIAWLSEENSFRKLAVWSRHPTESIQLPHSDGDHARMLLHVREHRGTVIFDPPVQTGYEIVVENVLPQTCVLAVEDDMTVRVLIEVLLPPTQTLNSHAQFRDHAEILCGIAGNYHRALSKPPGDAAALPIDIHKSLHVVETCYAIANEARQSLGCDRVTVLVKRGSRYVVKAVSGQEGVNRRANVVRFMERLTRCVLKMGDPFWYSEDRAIVGGSDQLAPEIEFDLEEYVEAAMCRRLGILPLSVTEKEHEQTDEEGPAPRGEIYGALVVEDFTDAVDRGTSFQSSVFEAAEHAAVSLRNAVNHESIFLLPIWRFLGEQWRHFFGTRRKIALAGCGAAMLAAVILSVVQIPFHIASEGHLQPTVRQNVFASVDGTVDQLHASHGKTVEKGELLVRLRNAEIDQELERLNSQIRQAQARLAALRTAQLSSLTADKAGSMDSAAESAQLAKSLVSLETQLAIQEQRKTQLAITSPIAGEIVTWNVEDRLRDRPVSTGQNLLKIAQLSGPWRLELNVPDRRVAHVLRADQASDEPLDVTFILASDPGKSYNGHVQQIAKSTRIDAVDGQSLLVLVAIDDEQLHGHRVGTEVQAKLYCGRRSIGYVWFHDILEFVQSRILFRLR